MTEIVPHEPARAPAIRQGRQRFLGGFFSMQGDMELYEPAGNTAIPTATRVQFAAMARGNIWGHAGFAPGELARIVRVGKNNRKQLNEAIKHLISWGVAAPNSTSRCIVLSSALYRRADRNRKLCEGPGHANVRERMWVSKLGWEHHPGLYQAELDRGNAGQMIEMRSRFVDEETEMTTTTTTTTRTRRRVTESALVAV